MVHIASFMLGIALTYPLVLVLGLWRPAGYSRLIGGGRIRFAVVATVATLALFVGFGVTMPEERHTRSGDNGALAGGLGFLISNAVALAMVTSRTACSKLPEKQAGQAERTPTRLGAPEVSASETRTPSRMAAAAIFERGTPQLPAAKPSLPAEQDAPEASALAGGGVPSARLALIEYKDANGNSSTRRITIRSVFPKNADFAITAFCHERQAERTFMASRIQTIADPFTGEVHDDPIGFIKRFVVFENDSPLDETSAVVLQSLPTIVILVALARCDGIFAREEVNFIADRVREWAGGRSYDQAQVMGLIRSLFPTESDVAKAIWTVVAAGGLDTLIAAMGELVAIDGQLSSQEKFFIANLRKILEGAPAAAAAPAAPATSMGSGNMKPATPRQINAVGKLGRSVIGLTAEQASIILTMRDYLSLLMDRLDKGRACDDEEVIKTALGKVLEDPGLSTYLSSERIRRAVQSERLPTGPERDAIAGMLWESGLA